MFTRLKGCAFGLAVLSLCATTHAAILSTSTGVYSGGDPGEGLKLDQPSSLYLYGLSFGNPSPFSNVTVGNVTFEPVKVTATQSVPPGVTVSATSINDFPDLPALGGKTIIYGGAGNDDNIEGVSKSQTLGDNITITLSLGAVPAGRPYELQVFTSDNPGAGIRIMKFTVDGTLAISGFTPKTMISTAGGYSGSTITRGAVATIVGTTTGSSLTVLIQGDTGTANQPLVSGLTLLIPEPASLTLLGLGGALAFHRKRR